MYEPPKFDEDGEVLSPSVPASSSSYVSHLPLETSLWVPKGLRMGTCLGFAVVPFCALEPMWCFFSLYPCSAFSSVTSGYSLSAVVPCGATQWC